MIVCERVYITFDPRTEYEAMQIFQQQNEIDKLFRVEPATAGVTFVRENTYYVDATDIFEEGE